MTTAVETEDPIPAWLPPAVLHAIRGSAGVGDPARAERYAGADAERVRHAIDHADDLLAAHRCYGDDEAIDMALARAALLVARGLVKPPTEDPDGR